MMRTVVYGVAKSTRTSRPSWSTRATLSARKQVLKVTGVDEDGEVSFEQLLAYAEGDSTAALPRVLRGPALSR